jgi:hypothetical protein
MYLVSVLLPLYDNAQQGHERKLFQEVARELTARFGGLTAHTRAPAEGLWSEDGQTTRDDIVIYEVIAERIDRTWWAEYRRTLQSRFRQEQVLIRAHQIDVL